MSRPERPISAARRAVALLLLAHVLAVMALAACPSLHHWAHPGADDDGHDCAVVWLLHGEGGAAPETVPVPAIGGAAAGCPVTTLPAVFVPSVFAASCVLEHAPPRRS